MIRTDSHADVSDARTGAGVDSDSDSDADADSEADQGMVALPVGGAPGTGDGGDAGVSEDST